jgi:hypothetical protein
MGVAVTFNEPLNCSSDAIDDPGVRGAPLNGLEVLRRCIFGDFASRWPFLGSGMSKEEFIGRGLQIIGEASPLMPTRKRFDRWSPGGTGSSNELWLRDGGERPGMVRKGGSMAAGESWADISPEKLGLGRPETEGEG